MYTALRGLLKGSHFETTSKLGLDLRQFVIIDFLGVSLAHHHFLGRPHNEEVLLPITFFLKLIYLL